MSSSQLQKTNIIVASNRPFPYTQVTNPEELKSCLTGWEPQYILFPFWSWKVPKEITDKYDCIGFHTGDTNGGSPIQNLIRQGKDKADIRMFHMNDTIDGGNVIGSIEVSLGGSLEEITMRISDKIWELWCGHIQTNNG